MRTVAELLISFGQLGRGFSWILAAVLGLGGSAAQAQVQGQTPDWHLEVLDHPTPIPGTPSANAYYISTMAADTSGRVYLAGEFRGTTYFDTTRLVNQGAANLFVACWNTRGQHFDWVTGVSSRGGVTASALVLGAGGLYLTGGLLGSVPNSTPTMAVFGRDTLVTSYANLYVAKLDLNGHFVWAQQTYGNAQSRSYAVAVSGTSVYVGGWFTGGTLQFGSQSFALPGGLGRAEDSFVVKLTDQGPRARPEWAQLFSGRNDELVSGLAAVGNTVYLAGTFASDTLRVGSTALVNPHWGQPEVFVAKLTDAGSSGGVGWAVQGGGPRVGLYRGLVATGTDMYLAGSFTGTGSLLGQPMAQQGTHPNLFAAKITDAGSHAQVGWVQQAGGTGYQDLDDLAVCGSTVYLGGHFTGGTLAFGTNVLTASWNVAHTAQGTDGFVAQLTDTGLGGTFDWAMQGGGPGFDTVNRLTTGGAALYIAGQVDTPASFGTQNFSSATGLNTNYLATPASVSQPRPPRLMAFAPTAGPAGTVVTLTGTHFTAASGVSFDGIAAPGFVVNAAGTQITVAVPAGASSGLLRVSTPGGTAVSSTAFTVQTALNTARSQATALALRPNPARGTATLHLPTPATEPLPLRIVDALGRTVRTQALPARATETTLDLTGLAPGLYLVRVGTATGRLVVE